MTSTGQWWLQPMCDWGILKMYRYPLAYDVLMLSNEHRNKILRCKHIPWITVVFCWRKCNIKRRHPGDIRGRTAALASPSRNAEEKVSLECTTRHPIRGKKIGDLKVIQSSFLQVEGMKWWGVAKPNLLFSQTTSTVGKFRHEFGSCFFLWSLIAFLKQFARSEGFITTRTLQREERCPLLTDKLD